MYSFIISILVLIAGYALYGRLTEKLFGPDDRETPAALLTQMDFNVLWRYFSWSNQTLAMISLWVATSFLIHKGKYRWGSLITALPATFMTGVTVTYLMMADEGFRMSAAASYPAGIIIALFVFVIYVIQMYQWRIADPEIRDHWAGITDHHHHREE